MGTMAKILVKGSLILNNKEPADLRLLENTRITLQTHNSVDYITVSKVIEPVTLKEDEDYIVEFQVPAGISSLRVNITTEVNVRLS
jgi:hypothetical protein